MPFHPLIHYFHKSYYLYLSEYCYLALEPNDPGGRMCNVYDLQVGVHAIF